MLLRALALPALGLASCVAPLAVVGTAGVAGVVATEEWKSNASARWFSLEPEAAWEQAVQLLEDMADTPVEIDAEAWTATALVNPHQYKLSVTETPTGGSRVSMAVRTYALWDRQESEAWLARYSKRIAALD